jgi:hypothetical protein
VTWLEAILLVSILLQDTNSWAQAAKSEWDYPVSRQWIVQAYTFDLLATVNGGKKKPKPYPAPWPDPSVNKIGSTKKRSDADVRRLLKMMNPEGD